MKENTIKTVVSDYKKQSGFNQALIWITVATFAVLALLTQQKYQEQAQYEQIGANYYDLTHPPTTGIKD